jgi:hypothetical protein
MFADEPRIVTRGYAMSPPARVGMVVAMIDRVYAWAHAQVGAARMDLCRSDARLCAGGV